MGEHKEDINDVLPGYVVVVAVECLIFFSFLGMFKETRLK